MRWTAVRKVGCGGSCCAAARRRAVTMRASRCISEPQAHGGLQRAHGIGPCGIPELRTRDDRVDRRERDAVEDVRGGEAPFEIPAAAEPDDARDARVEREL